METYKYQIFSDIDERTMYDFSSFIDRTPKESEIIIEITSHGGLVFYGNAVFQKIQEAQSQGTRFIARVYGLAASSAADIVLACDVIEMASTAAIMIHSAWNPVGKKDEGIAIANAAQLAVIKKRLPDYDEESLKKDRWFTADEALEIGLIDSIFNAQNDREQALLCAKYLSTYAKGEKSMDEEKKLDPANGEEIIEEEEEKKEEIRQPSVEELLERIVERLDEYGERLRKIEEMNAECGGDRRDNARLKAIYDRVANVSKPCVSTDSVIKSPVENPKAELERMNEKYPNLERFVGND
jgi:ATP-dependent protease ClpP protease subunit